MEVIDSVLELARKGFWPFPLAPNTKIPLKGSNGVSDATREEEALKKMFPVGCKYNIGIAGKYFDRFLCIVDVDSKGSGHDTISFEAAVNARDLPPTLQQHTPTGGIHFIYVCDKPIGNPVGAFPGVDIRGDGGYIVAAPSQINGKVYRFADGSAPTAAPAWMRQFEKEVRDQRQASTQIGSTDHFELLEMVKFIQTQDHQDEGGRNAKCYQLATHLLEHGIAPDITAVCIDDFWDRADGFDSGEIRRTVASAVKSMKKEPGWLDPSSIFSTPVDTADPNLAGPEDKRKAICLEKFIDLELAGSSDYLVKNFIDKKALSVMYGASNVGKSFMSIDLAMHVALGKEWFGHEVKQGAVVYVAAEAPQSIKKRLVAFREANGLRGVDAPFYIYGGAITLTDPKKSEELAALCEAVKPSLIVVDTLSRVMGALNENQADHMNAFVSNMDFLRFRTGAHVMIVHHAGKNTGLGARGSSALQAAVDSEFEVEKGMLRVTKQREYETGEKVYFELVDVLLGAEVKSAVVKVRGAPKEAKIQGDAGRAIGLLDFMLACSSEVSFSAWREEYYKVEEERRSRETERVEFNKIIDQVSRTAGGNFEIILPDGPRKSGMVRRINLGE